MTQSTLILIAAAVIIVAGGIWFLAVNRRTQRMARRDDAIERDTGVHPAERASEHLQDRRP